MLLTREVRWFFDGPLPERASAWFTAGATAPTAEHRVDIYDVEAAQRGVGRKLRAGDVLDTKVRVAGLAAATLAGGAEGRVEDWFKVSEPVNGHRGLILRRSIEISKVIRSRRYLLDGDVGVDVGCEVELAAVAAAGVQSWTLCLETFGSPHRRHGAITRGMQRLIEDSPLPAYLRLHAATSCSYPEWISRVVDGGPAARLA